MKHPLTVAVIGSGYMGKRHLEIFLKKAERVILCSNDVEKGAALAASCGCAFYADHKELLEKERIDVASVCVPTHLHAPITVDLLRAGVHVLCEKPFASTLEDAEKMIRTSRESGKLLMIAHCERFSKQYEYLRRCIADGRFGKLSYLNLYRHNKLPAWSVSNWLLNFEVSGGVVRDLHVHDTDLIHHILGIPTSVCTSGNSLTCSTLYRFENGTSVTASGSWRTTDSYRGGKGYDAVFEGAVLRFKGKKVVLMTNDGESEVLVAEEKLPPYFEESMYENEIEYFCQCVRQGVRPEHCLPEDSLTSLRINLAESQSLSTGKTVEL